MSAGAMLRVRHQAGLPAVLLQREQKEAKGHQESGKSNQTPPLPVHRVLVQTTCDRTAVCAVIYPLNNNKE